MTTATRPSAARPGRGRTMQDELLDDLRQATPMPIAAVPPPPTAPVAPEQTPQSPVQRARTEEPATPSLHVHLSLQRWSWPRLRLLPGWSGLSVGIGPVRMSCALRGR